MCLKAVDKMTARKSGVGYKLAEKKNGTFFSCDYRRTIGGVTYPLVTYPLETWITDDADYPIRAGDGQHYRTGFHISLSEEHVRELAKHNNARMENLVTIKCKFRRVVASDMENDTGYGPVVVARELMNLGEI